MASSIFRWSFDLQLMIDDPVSGDVESQFAIGLFKLTNREPSGQIPLKTDDRSSVLPE
jgi:hypothetical protein